METAGKSMKLAWFLVLTFMFIASPMSGFCKDKIVIGTAISLSGGYAPGAGMTQVPNYHMWVEEVNAKGGIFVREYNKRLPVELIVYDDKSDIGTAVKLVEKLILEDKVDLLLPPWGTAMHFAVAPVANRYGYPLLGPTISSEKLRELSDKIPYFFGVLNMPREQGTALAELVAELGPKKIALIYVADAYGIEWAGVVSPALKERGLTPIIEKSYPLGSKDLSPLLKEIKAANVDALLGMSYPGDTFLITTQSQTLKLNPDLFYLGVGVAFPGYRDRFGAAAVEG